MMAKAGGDTGNEGEFRSSLMDEERKQMEAAASVVKRRRKPAEPQEETDDLKLEHRHRAQSIISGKALDELETEVFETGLYENVDLHRGSQTSVLVAEITYSYLWWSVFQALPSAIWFYPLCALELSGFEVICLVWFAPLLVLIVPVRRALTTPLGLLILRLLTLIGVASLQGPTTLSRLLILGTGNFFAMLTLCATWWGLSKLDRHRYVYCHMLGYLLMLAIRIWFTSFDPILSNFTINSASTLLGGVLALYLYINNWRTPIVEVDEPSKHPRAGTRFPGVVATGFGFGALLFLTLYLFGDVSVLSRWAVASYPHRGPYPYPWSLATMLALTVGFVVFGHQKHLLGSLGWFIFGLTNALVLYFAQSYVAFFAGLILAVYTTSLWPSIVKRMIRHPPGKVLGIAALSYILLTLLSAWVVAYNFVPGGTITRERTEVLLVILVGLVGVASREVQPSTSKASTTARERRRQEKRRQEERKKDVVFAGRMLRRLSTISEEESEMDTSGGEEGTKEGKEREGSIHARRTREVALGEEKEYRKFQSKVIKAAMVIFLFSVLGIAYRYQPITSMPQKEHPREFSAGIWAFHFGYDNDGYNSMERAAQLIADTDVDVIGLLETDAARPYIGNHDIASWLSERLHMYVDYGPGPKDHTWGALILSKYPIIKSEHFLLPSPEGELAPAILASVNISGEIVNIYCVHFGNDVDVLDRKLQAERSAEILANATDPVVMISYITNKPGSRDYRRIVDSGNVKDIDPTDRHRWCEYLFYRGVIRLGYARISHGGLSDTEVQIGKFWIPETPGEPDNEVMTHDPKDVPEWIHFPSRFGSLYQGHFRDETQHHFHMNTPKYFTHGRSTK